MLKQLRRDESNFRCTSGMLCMTFIPDSMQKIIGKVALSTRCMRQACGKMGSILECWAASIRKQILKNGAHNRREISMESLLREV